MSFREPGKNRLPRLGWSAAIGLAIILWPAAPLGAPRCARPEIARSEVLSALDGWYAALRTDDLESFGQAITDDFVAFDAGGVYPGLGLARAVKVAHESGKTFIWSVDEPLVRLDCHSALVTYVNHGQVRTVAGDTNVVWLESATLRWESGAWKVAFFHSSLAKPVP